MQPLFEDTDNLTLNVVLSDQLDIRIIYLVTLVEVHAHCFQGAHWVDCHVFLLIGLDDVADLSLVQQNDLSDVTGLRWLVTS